MMDLETIKKNPIWDGIKQEYIKNFWRYHSNNPHVLDLFMKFAKEAKATGRERYSIWTIAQRIRWHTTVETHGDDFKISNNHLACYARLLVILEPRFEGFFSLHVGKGGK